VHVALVGGQGREAAAQVDHVDPGVVAGEGGEAGRGHLFVEPEVLHQERTGRRDVLHVQRHGRRRDLHRLLLVLCTPYDVHSTL